MNLESLNNIGGRIESEDPKEKKTILFEKIEQISLVFAYQKFEEIKKVQGNYKLSEAIKDYAPIENIITRPVFHLDGFNLAKYQEQINQFIDNFYVELDSIYESRGFNLDEMTELVNSKRDSLKSYLGAEGLPEYEKKSGITKIMSFNKITNIEIDAEKKYKDLVKLGFTKDDHFVEVHLDDFYNSGEKNFSSELITNDLAAIAVRIIDKEQEAVAVIGKSWLLNAKLADLLGFKKITDGVVKQNDFSTWLQFIDKNGQINSKRFDKFLQTGELPFPSVVAYIPIEDFLKRYLPESRRGKINLKEINIERKDYWARLQIEAESIRSDWSELLKNNGDFDNFVKNNQALNDIFTLITPTDRSEYLDFLKIMYNSNILWSEFFEHKSAKIEAIDEKINQARRDDLYKNKEVVI